MPDVFLDETLKALRKDILESHKLNRELLDVLRDLRDELAYIRERRTKRERRIVPRETEERRKLARRG